MRHTKRIPSDKNQTEFFGIIWLTSEPIRTGYARAMSSVTTANWPASFG